MTAAHYLRVYDEPPAAQAVIDPGADAYYLDGSGEAPMMPLNRLRLVLSRRLSAEQKKLEAFEQYNEPDADSSYLCGRCDMLKWAIETIDLIQKTEK
jgi:hypothetical protein